MDKIEEYFGSPEQRKMMQRAEALWPLVKHHPYLGTHGRSIGVAPGSPDAFTMQVALAKLTGVSAYDGIASDAAPDWEAALVESGLKVDSYARWQSSDETLDRAGRILGTYPLPDSMKRVIIDATTAPERLYELSDAIMEAGGVLLPNGRVMRGIDSASVCLMAHDEKHRPAASAASVAMFDKTGTTSAWWGLLATIPEYRGKGLALRLGAEAMLEMNRKYGTTVFYTGIRDGNEPSEKLCAKLGMAPNGSRIIIAIDPDAFSGSQVTK